MGDASRGSEPLLFRLARGTGLDGLGGMRPKREQADGPAIIRPMLGVRRAEILAALADAGLQALSDPSNQDVGLARNRIRHEVLPRRNTSPCMLSIAQSSLTVPTVVSSGSATTR